MKASLISKEQIFQIVQQSQQPEDGSKESLEVPYQEFDLEIVRHFDFLKTFLQRSSFTQISSILRQEIITFHLDHQPH